MTIAGLQAMKPAGRKIVGVVAWDYQIARIADRAVADAAQHQEDGTEEVEGKIEQLAWGPPGSAWPRLKW